MSISHHSQIKLLFSSFLEYEFSFGFFFSKTRWSSHTLVSIFLHLLWFLYQKQMDLWLFWKKKYIPISWESIYFITHPCKQAGKKRRFFKVGGPMNKILVLRNKRFFKRLVMLWRNNSKAVPANWSSFWLAQF